MRQIFEPPFVFGGRPRYLCGGIINALITMAEAPFVKTIDHVQVQFEEL